MKKTEKSDAHYKKIFPKYRQIFKIITSKKFGLKFKNPVCYDEPVLILCNHTNDFDFMVVSAMFKMHAYAMCSQHVLGIKFLGKLVETKLNPIAVYKGSDKSSYVMEMVRRIRRGNSVLLFPEGKLSHNGLTGEIGESTAKLCKIAKCKVVTVRIKGGFFIEPRWQTCMNGGKLISAEVVGEYDKEYLANAPLDEIYTRIKEDLFVDAYAEQEKYKRKYKFKKGAEGIQRYYNVCPKCRSLDTITTSGKKIFCTCGYSFDMDDYGYFHGENLGFDTALGWEKIMLEEYERHFNQGGVIFSDQSVTLYSLGKAHSRKEMLKADLKCTDKGLEIGDKTFEFDRLEGGDILVGGSSFVFGYDGVHYELFKENACLNKYCLCYKRFSKTLN